MERSFKYRRLDKANAAVLLVDHQSGLCNIVGDFSPDDFKNNVLALADLAKDGVRTESWSDELMSAFRRAWNVVAEEEGSRDPLFKKIFDDLEKFRSGQPSTEPSSASSAP